VCYGRRKIDVNLGGIRIRGFGNQEEKQKAYERDWQEKHPDWSKKVPAGLSISSKVPEIWCDLKQDKNGNIILPLHVIGHEMQHTLRINNNKIADPDTLINKDIYK